MAARRLSPDRAARREWLLDALHLDRLAQLRRRRRERRLAVIRRWW